MSRAPALSREHQSCGLFWERQKIHGSASPEKLHPPPTSCSPGRPLGRISSVSRAPGDGKDGQDAAHRSHCAARASKGISSDAAGPCASVLSAGWNLRGVQRRRAKTGLPSPKGACGLKLRRLRLRVSPRPRNPQRLAMGRRWQGQAHRSARQGEVRALRACDAGPVVQRGLRADGRDRQPNQAWPSWPLGHCPSRTLSTSTWARGYPLPGVSMGWGSRPQAGRIARLGSRPWPHCRCETNTDAKEASLQCAAVPGHQD